MFRVKRDFWLTVGAVVTGQLILGAAVYVATRARRPGNAQATP